MRNFSVAAARPREAAQWGKMGVPISSEGMTLKKSNPLVKTVGKGMKRGSKMRAFGGRK
jgi:hypothetical protein